MFFDSAQTDLSVRKRNIEISYAISEKNAFENKNFFISIYKNTHF